MDVAGIVGNRVHVSSQLIGYVGDVGQLRFGADLSASIPLSILFVDGSLYT